MNEGVPFRAAILDFNPARMTAEEASAKNIPPYLVDLVGDKRQYPFNIARHFPEGVSWLNTSEPWFFRQVLTDQRRVSSLLNNNILILTGSGMSAFYFQEGLYNKLPEPKDAELLKQTEAIVKGELGEGKWVLGICFGGQIAVHVVGGRLGRLPVKPNGVTITEAGWLEQELTDAGRKDKVFAIVPRKFYAPHLHSDFVDELPTVGTTIHTSHGDITVTAAQVLAVRKGYLDTDGLKNVHNQYVQASVVIFDNGARLYQIQPHPEMATRDKANFLVRQNPWIGKDTEMGEAYYKKALEVSLNANFAVSRVIRQFVELARENEEMRQQVTFTRAAIAQNLRQLAPYLIK